MSTTYYARLSTSRYGDGVELIDSPSLVSLDNRLRRGDSWRDVVREYVHSLRLTRTREAKRMRKEIGAMWRRADETGDRIVIDRH